ncbi:MAG: hypothetical protein IPM47_20975 [Sphingobacteriales bacterium]|nr:MAG: hypothetical protein IPM47_20975 [Sphingobacteriales bacterium]
MIGHSIAQIGAKKTFGFVRILNQGIVFNEWVLMGITLVDGHVYKLKNRNGEY